MAAEGRFLSHLFFFLRVWPIVTWANHTLIVDVSSSGSPIGESEKRVFFFLPTRKENSEEE